METLRQDIAYALRQMRQSPVFTLTAMLTLALGIGATTAIFSLIHTVMLKSLPVVDPASLYRIGDGSDCCVEGSPQDNWGMFSYPFYLRMKEPTPEFASWPRSRRADAQFSARRGESDRVAKPLRGEFVTGNYFSTFGVGAFAGRTIRPSDDQPTAPPVAMLSYRAWQQQYGSDPRIVGSTIDPGRSSGHHRRHHAARILRRDAAQRSSRGLAADPAGAAVPRQELSAASLSGVAARDRPASSPGASPNALPARLTSLLRVWLVNESGMPAEWMAGIKAGLPKQNIKVVPAGTGVGVMKAELRATACTSCSPSAAWCC